MEKYKVLLKSFFKKKKLTKFCMMIFVTVITSNFLIFGIKNKINDEFGRAKKDNVDHYYVVSRFDNNFENEIQQIQKIEHVKNAYFFLVKQCGNYFYTYIDSNLYEIIKGSEIKKSNDIIIPSECNNQLCDNFGNELNIVGTYHLKHNVVEIPPNTILTSYDYITKVSKNDQKKVIIIEVDDFGNVRDVAKILSTKYNSETTIFSSNTNTLSKYKLFSKIVDISIIIFEIVYIALFIILAITIFHDERKDNAILRILGYQAKIISTSFILKISIIYIFTFLVILVPVCIIRALFKSIIFTSITDFIAIFLNLYFLLLISSLFSIILNSIFRGNNHKILD